MQLKYLYSIEGAHATASVYKHKNGDQVVWVKVGQALLEVPMDIWDDFHGTIRATNFALYDTEDESEEAEDHIIEIEEETQHAGF